jgi:signal transduction histidine kinase
LRHHTQERLEVAQWKSDERVQRETVEEGFVNIHSETQTLGYSVEERLERPLADLMSDTNQHHLRRSDAEPFEPKLVREGGSDLWDNNSIAQRLLAWEKGALELIVGPGSMGEVLDQLVISLEEHLAGGMCSVLLLDQDGQHLHHGAAPNLPEAYNRAVDGVAIGPAVGSCGAAVHARRQIVVSDISQDALWVDFRSLALHFGLQACWSTPIQGNHGKILGTFAIYYSEPRSPSPWELETIDRAVHIAYLAIERKQSEEKLRLVNRELESSVAARTEQLRALAYQLTRTEERERLRVADTLHEGLLQTLLVVAMGLDSLKKHFPEIDSRVEDLRQELCKAMNQGRSLTYEIYPPALQFKDFGYALECLGKRHQDQQGLEVTVQAPSGFYLHEEELRLFLYRAANELLVNVRRHAQSPQARMVLSLAPNQAVRLMVMDSGTGFELAAVKAREGQDGGFGLFSLRERVKALGGTLEIHSGPGQGTCVTVTVPQSL